jgi:hypothetical protein
MKSSDPEGKWAPAHALPDNVLSTPQAYPVYHNGSH